MQTKTSKMAPNQIVQKLWCHPILEEVEKSWEAINHSGKAKKLWKECAKDTLWIYIPMYVFVSFQYKNLEILNLFLQPLDAKPMWLETGRSVQYDYLQNHAMYLTVHRSAWRLDWICGIQMASGAGEGKRRTGVRDFASQMHEQWLEGKALQNCGQVAFWWGSFLSIFLTKFMSRLFFIMKFRFNKSDPLVLVAASHMEVKLPPSMLILAFRLPTG